MLENYIRKQVFNRIVGPDGNPHTLASVLDEVEDADFQGREDTHLGTEKRVQALLAEMTLEEKVRMAGGYERMGIQRLQRLGLPTVWCSDATSGLRCFPGGTAFLSGVAMAATWDPELVEKVGAAVGEEFRAKGVSILLGPGVNIYRVPTCGRNFEYMGEDPFLAGKIAAAYIRGAQSKGVLTTVKHFVANNSDYDRHKTDSVVSERALREIYFPAFKMAVQEGGSWGVMNAYNPVNGVYASENKFLLKQVLRDEWGFKGFVISDWTSVYSTVPAIKNGLNLEMPFGKWINDKTVTRAIEAGELVEEDVEAMIKPLLTALFEAGVYDTPQIDPEAKINTVEHLELAQRSAEASVVLLKNEGSLLPLDPKKIKKLVVMGRTAANTPTGGGGSCYVHRPESPDVLAGIRKEFPGSHVDYIPFRKDKISFEEEQLIRAADVVILGAGFYTYEESESFDRAWVMPERQGEMIKNVCALNPNVAVVLTVGGGVETQSWVHSVPALLHTFYLGETAGTVIGRTLSGLNNPGGKLPFTMAKQWEDFESTKYYVDRPETVRFQRLKVGQGNPKRRKVWKMHYGEGLRVGYRHFDTAQIDPQFSFGHGLGYSTFVLEDFEVKSEESLVKISLKVRNTGQRAGSEVVQCYVHDVETSVFRPDKELKAFKKVYLQPGQVADVSLVLDDSAFSFFDEEQGEWRLEPGDFEIRIGTSSREIIHSQIITR